MKKQYVKGETLLRVKQASSPHLELVYEGCSPHNGEYWYKCPRCGKSDWIASYGSPVGLLDHLPCKEE